MWGCFDVWMLICICSTCTLVVHKKLPLFITNGLVAAAVLPVLNITYRGLNRLICAGGDFSIYLLTTSAPLNFSRELGAAFLVCYLVNGLVIQRLAHIRTLKVR